MIEQTNSGSRPLSSVRRKSSRSLRREELLQAASDLLLTEGFTSLTVDDLARRLKCSKSTLYGVAPTKEQLVLRVTKRFFSDATEHIESEISSVDSPPDQIGSYLKGVGAQMSKLSPAFYRDMVGFAPTAEIYALNSAVAAQRTRELIANGVRSGHFRAINADFAGHLIAWSIEGIQGGRFQESLGITAGDAYRELGDLLLKGLGHPETS